MFRILNNDFPLQIISSPGGIAKCFKAFRPRLQKILQLLELRSLSLCKIPVSPGGNSLKIVQKMD